MCLSGNLGEGCRVDSGEISRSSKDHVNDILGVDVGGLDRCQECGVEPGDSSDCLDGDRLVGFGAEKAVGGRADFMASDMGQLIIAMDRMQAQRQVEMFRQLREIDEEASCGRDRRVERREARREILKSLGCIKKALS